MLRTIIRMTLRRLRPVDERSATGAFGGAYGFGSIGFSVGRLTDWRSPARGQDRTSARRVELLSGGRAARRTKPALDRRPMTGDPLNDQVPLVAASSPW